MANLNYITKNIYTEAADKSEESSQAICLILGIIISIPFLFITPVLGILVVFVALIIAIGAGKNKTVLLRSGAAGENHVLSILSKLPDQFCIFNQVIIPNPRAKRGFNEIDFVVIGDSALIIVEVKNHKGHVTGNESDYDWNIQKIGRRGTPYEITMYNPLKQVKNQFYALQNYFKSNGLSTSIIPIVVFTNPECSYEISYSTKSAYVIRDEDLIDFIIDVNSKFSKTIAGSVLNELINLKKGNSKISINSDSDTRKVAEAK